MRTFTLLLFILYFVPIYGVNMENNTYSVFITIEQPKLIRNIRV